MTNSFAGDFHLPQVTEDERTRAAKAVAWRYREEIAGGDVTAARETLQALGLIPTTK